MLADRHGLRRYPMAAAGAPGRCGDCPAFIHGPMYGRMPVPGNGVAGYGTVADHGAMTWIAPAVTRVHEPVVADERATLDGLLEWHRATLLGKCAGLTGEQLAGHPVPPSGLSLLGLIRHLAETERAWFRRRAAGQPVPDLLRAGGSPGGGVRRSRRGRGGGRLCAPGGRVGTVPRGGARAAAGSSVPPPAMGIAVPALGVWPYDCGVRSPPGSRRPVAGVHRRGHRRMTAGFIDGSIDGSPVIAAR